MKLWISIDVLRVWLVERQQFELLRAWFDLVVLDVHADQEHCNDVTRVQSNRRRGTLLTMCVVILGTNYTHRPSADCDTCTTATDVHKTRTSSTYASWRTFLGIYGILIVVTSHVQWFACLAHFGLPWVLPWVLPWDNRGKCYMDGKRIQCWSNA